VFRSRLAAPQTVAFSDSGRLRQSGRGRGSLSRRSGASRCRGPGDRAYLPPPRRAQAHVGHEPIARSDLGGLGLRDVFGQGTNSAADAAMAARRPNEQGRMGTDGPRRLLLPHNVGHARRPAGPVPLPRTSSTLTTTGPDARHYRFNRRRSSLSMGERSETFPDGVATGPLLLLATSTGATSCTRLAHRRASDCATTPSPFRRLSLIAASTAGRGSRRFEHGSAGCRMRSGSR
jgi:hypothetical protein